MSVGVGGRERGLQPHSLEAQLDLGGIGKGGLLSSDSPGDVLTFLTALLKVSLGSDKG